MGSTLLKFSNEIFHGLLGCILAKANNKSAKPVLPARDLQYIHISLKNANLKSYFLAKKLQTLAGKVFFFGIFSLCCLAINPSYAANDTQISRYATIANQPTAAQVNPLLAVAQYKFPPSVRTVGDAINAVLQNTSYQLVPSDKLSRSVKENLQKPLPITVRTLGPIEIKDALVVLIGRDVFTLVGDPLHRLVNFKVKPNMAKALGVQHAN